MGTTQLQKKAFWPSFIKIFRSKEMIISVLGGTILLFLEVYINRLNPPQQGTPNNNYTNQSKTTNNTFIISDVKKNDDSRTVAKGSVDSKQELKTEQKIDPSNSLMGIKKKDEPILHHKFVEPTITPETQSDIPVLVRVNELEMPETKPDDPKLQLVKDLPDQTNPNGLHDYYGLDLNLVGRSITYTIGSPAITRYFKLKGSKHKGLFVITPDGLYFTSSDPVVYDQSCNFYKIYAVYGGGGSGQTDKPCPGSFFKLYGKLSVYPCDGNIFYKIGNSIIEQADEYKFKKP